MVYFIVMNKIVANLIKTFLILTILLWPTFSLAQNLEIKNIRVAIVEEVVVISWDTNIASQYRLDYGLTTDYDQHVSNAGVYRTDHRVEIRGLEEKKLYHYKITAIIPGESVSTFDAAFKTDELKDNTTPKISDVSVVFITSETITLQWTTNEKTKGKVFYGKTDTYGKTASTGLNTRHDVTISKLTPGAIYHINIEAEDQDKNKARWYDFTVRTQAYKSIENEDLQVLDIRPSTSGDLRIGTDQVTISWRTNKLANGSYAYSTRADRLGSFKEIKDVFRNFSHEVTVTKLKPDTTYYFQVSSKDIFGKTTKSQIFSVKTYALPKVLGDKIINTADINARLIKDVNTSRIYYLYKNSDNSKSKIYISSPTIFNSYASNRWADVVTVSHTVATGYQDVRLIKEFNSPAVYLLEDGTKRPFVNAKAFETGGYRWSDIKLVNKTHLDSIPTGQIIQ